jgi:hypothetical protein
MNGFPKRASNSSRSQGREAIILDLPTVRKMLPLVRHVVAELMAIDHRVGPLVREQDGLERNRRSLSWPERQRRYQLQDEVVRLTQQRKEAVGELEGLGVQVIDPETGRVGFPTIVNTKPAYFSWQPCEEEVGYWHFAGDADRRRPIPISWTKETPVASHKRK